MDWPVLSILLVIPAAVRALPIRVTTGVNFALLWSGYLA